MLDSSELRAGRRGYAFVALCLGTLMIALDSTIVNIALNSIRNDLHCSETGLVWVVNAYLLTFAGFLLLAGRLGDLYGQRRLFLLGVLLFTLASLGCGLAEAPWALICARAAQGLGGAVVWVLGLSITLSLFPVPRERVRAMATFAFVISGGGTVALLLGGVLTTALNWHWIFLVNMPVGVVVYVLGLKTLPKDERSPGTLRLDVGGACVLTAAMITALYAIVESRTVDRSSAQMLALSCASMALFLGFVGVEAHVRHPLVPLGIFRRNNLAVCSIIQFSLSAVFYAWGFIGALYMQQVLKYSPLTVGLAFLPASLISAAFALGLSSRLVTRFGNRSPLTVGLLFLAAGVAFFVQAPLDGRYVVGILPGMILVGVGIGMAPAPLTLAAMSDVSLGESGLASGIVNTASVMGAALGLSSLVGVAAARTDELTPHMDLVVALNSGYHAAFFAGAVLIGVTAWFGSAFLHTMQQKSAL